MELIDFRGYPNFSFFFDPDEQLRTFVEAGASGPLPSGQYAVAWEAGGEIYLARDPIGCTKLFYGDRGDGAVLVANRIERLIRAGLNVDSIRSCPPGRVVVVTGRGTKYVGGRDILANSETERFQLGSFQQRVKDVLEGAMKALAVQLPSARFVVCLSGGLDSSVIAAMAKRWLPNLTAFSFSYLPEGALAKWLQEGKPERVDSASEDYCTAVSVAAALDLPIVPVIRTPESVAPVIEQAVRLGQDYRDFNVHCAVVNLFLAQDIRAHFPGERVVVLTGDLMNEYVCDYHSEVVEDATYYPQPRVRVESLRRFFVRGLDAGDRETGVFGAFDLELIQPYQEVAALYMSVPPALLEQNDAKWLLNSPLLPEALRRHIGRAKRRAQVGGVDGGTLGVFHRLRMTEENLLMLWARSLGGCSNAEVKKLIEFGRYRVDAVA